MNVFQQNQPEQNYPEIKSLVDLASIPIAQKLFSNPSYYNNFLKDLPWELKAPISLALSKVLTEKMEYMLSEDHALQGFSFFKKYPRIVTRDSINERRIKTEKALKAITMVLAFVVAALCALGIGHLKTTSSEKALLGLGLMVAIVIFGFISYLLIRPASQAPDKRPPQSSLIPELSRLVGIIHKTIECVEQSMVNLPKEIENVRDAIKKLPQEIIEKLPIEIVGMYKAIKKLPPKIINDLSDEDRKSLTKIKRELKIIEGILKVDEEGLMCLKGLFNLDSLNGSGNYSFSREQFRNILMDFHALSKKFTPELYTVVLGDAFCKLDDRSQYPEPDYQSLSSNDALAKLTDIVIDTPRIASSRHTLLAAQKPDDEIPLLLEVGQPPLQIKNYGTLEAAPKPG
jgi:hypothetical protein